MSLNRNTPGRKLNKTILFRILKKEEVLKSFNGNFHKSVDKIKNFQKQNLKKTNKYVIKSSSRARLFF